MQLTRHVKGTKQIDRVTGVYVANTRKWDQRHGFDRVTGVYVANSTRKAEPNKLIELQGFMQLTRHVKGTKEIDRVTGVYVANSTRKGDQTN